MWRALIVTLCVTIASVSAVKVWYVLPRHTGTIGVSTAFVAPHRYRVLAVQPGSPAERAGIRSGDIFALDEVGPDVRWRMEVNDLWAGQPIRLAVERSGRTRQIDVTPAHIPFLSLDRSVHIGQIVGWAGFVWALLFAGVIGWLRADSPRARLLAFSLIALMTTDVFQLYNWKSPSVGLDMSMNVLSWAAAAISWILLVVYALTFARPVALRRRMVAWITVAVVVIDAIPTPLIGILTDRFDLNDPAFQYFGVSMDSLAVSALVAVVGMALQASRGEERSRLAWSAIPLLAIFATEVVGEAFGATLGLSADFQNVVDNAAQFLAPVGLTYALLSRQLLDIGFALNRASVFAATSLLVAGVFAVLQFGANTLLAAMTPVHGFLSQVVIVTIVYYVVRLSRHRTDAFVTRVFFAARDRRLRALREALDAIDEVSDPDAIASFAVHFLATRASMETCIYFEQADGNYAPASGCESGARTLMRDEAGVIALRARRQPLHVPELQSLGDVAFPMMVHQRMSGIMLCRAANQGELAPDDIHALARIAERVVGDRYYLQAEALRRELDTLRLGEIALSAGRSSAI